MLQVTNYPRMIFSVMGHPPLRLELQLDKETAMSDSTTKARINFFILKLFLLQR